MEDSKLCAACGAELVGPFLPKITLSQALSQAQSPASGAPQTGDPEKGEGEAPKVAARAWTCPGCGLLHWYVEDQDLEKLLDGPASGEFVHSKPGASYERRIQMLRMLRRVRRM